MLQCNMQYFESERKQERDRLRKEALSIHHAIETRDPSAAKAIYDDKYSGWLCKKCPYLNKCKAMRNVSVEEAALFVSTWKE